MGKKTALEQAGLVTAKLSQFLYMRLQNTRGGAVRAAVQGWAARISSSISGIVVDSGSSGGRSRAIPVAGQQRRNERFRRVHVLSGGSVQACVNNIVLEPSHVRSERNVLCDYGTRQRDKDFQAHLAAYVEVHNEQWFAKWLSHRMEHATHIGCTRADEACKLSLVREGQRQMHSR
eukprot:COSAG02_NODE_4233_length_5606_cov_115.218230_4_plen_176_part_00